MINRRSRVSLWFGEAFLADPARPVELISLCCLAGWLQFLLAQPAIFAGDRYKSFAWLPPIGWAAIIGGIIVAQLVAIWPSRHATLIRFLAMALAAAIWVAIAASFWSSDVAPTAARTNTVLASAAFVTAIYLGLIKKA